MTDEFEEQGFVFQMVQSLSHQQRHILADCEWGGDHGAELAAVGDDALDVELVDDVIHLLSGADNPNLRSVAMWMGQQLVER